MSSHRVLVGTLVGLFLLWGLPLAGQQPEASDLDSAPMAADESVVFDTPSPETSKVRIVRLSDLPQPRTSEVQVDLNNGNGFQDSILNMPVVEGMKIQTLRTNQAVAEIEFEDLSTLRLTPDTLVQFTQLGNLSTQGLTTTVKLLQGTVYVTLRETKGNVFALTFGGNRVLVTPSSHLRLTYTAKSEYLAVFHGEVKVIGPWGTEIVRGGRGLRLEPGEEDQRYVAKLSKGADPYDYWDQAQDKYHDLYAKKGSCPKSVIGEERLWKKRGL